MNIRLAVIVLVLLAFGLFSIELTLATGYFGFARLAAREPWGLQLLLDVGISIGLFVAWMVPDARARGITVWPYAIACLLLGSMGALAYLAHRELKHRGLGHSSLPGGASR